MTDPLSSSEWYVKIGISAFCMLATLTVERYIAARRPPSITRYQAGWRGRRRQRSDRVNE
jgi:hypothetical protein